MNLILLEPHEAADPSAIELTGARARHALDVLKVSPGQPLHIGVVDGPRGVGVVTATTGDEVSLRAEWETVAPPLPSVDLILALPRPKVMKRLWAQLAALGVGRIMLVNAARVERPYFDTHVLEPACYRPLLLEGLQQARDTRLPVISIHRRLKVFVEDELHALAGDALQLLADTGPGERIARAIENTASRRCVLAVGPEGGWNDFERGLFLGRGFRTVTMRDRMLRSDTACVALLACVHEALAAAV